MLDNWVYLAVIYLWGILLIIPLWNLTDKLSPKSNLGRVNKGDKELLPLILAWPVMLLILVASVAWSLVFKKVFDFLFEVV